MTDADFDPLFRMKGKLLMDYYGVVWYVASIHSVSKSSFIPTYVIKSNHFKDRYIETDFSEISLASLGLIADGPKEDPCKYESEQDMLAIGQLKKFNDMKIIGKCFTEADGKLTLDARTSFKVDGIVEDVYEINAFEMRTKFRTITEFVNEILDYSDKHKYVYCAHYNYGNVDDWRGEIVSLMDRIEDGTLMEISESKWKSLKQGT
jgi:hypothetical protein